MWIIVTTQFSSGYSGIPRLGVTAYGPFETEEKAKLWLVSAATDLENASCIIVEMKRPV